MWRSVPHSARIKFIRLFTLLLSPASKKTSKNLVRVIEISVPEKHLA